MCLSYINILIKYSELIIFHLCYVGRHKCNTSSIAYEIREQIKFLYQILQCQNNTCTTLECQTNLRYPRTLLGSGAVEGGPSLARADPDHGSAFLVRVAAAPLPLSCYSQLKKNIHKHILQCLALSVVILIEVTYDVETQDKVQMQLKDHRSHINR